MSEQIKKMEDVFNEFLTGDDLRNALNFAEFSNSSEMIYNGSHQMHYKGKCACYIDLPNEQNKWWSVWTVGDFSNVYEDFLVDERIKEIAWSNVVKCGNCNDMNCNPGKTEVIFGKEFTGVCNGTENLAMRFMNPDAEALECVKKMVEMTRYVIDNHIPGS